MEVSDVAPAYIVHFKGAFTEDLHRPKENTSLSWLKVATALDPRFKDLRCLPRAEREEVWRKLSEMLKDREPASPPSTERSESDDKAQSTDTTLVKDRAEPSVSMEACTVLYDLFGGLQNRPLAETQAYPILSTLQARGQVCVRLI
ncbi:hypothetical protein N1851_030604 [Merluccius polli]|uniref:Uncharacterized protein n=1 Tax=Merluccius polli TaxID=89951 RepID=A0AA47NPV5_MERPO|nr:hypothetical protein N1851_030604 [Merluccius polli]